jgi:hypothetical protein
MHLGISRRQRRRQQRICQRLLVVAQGAGKAAATLQCLRQVRSGGFNSVVISRCRQRL